MAAVHHLHTEIEIAATAARVWDVLADFAAYPQWNPFIRQVIGEPRPGSRLRIAVQPVGGRVMRFSPIVLAAEPGRELCWLGRVLCAGIFDGEHRFVIAPLGDGRVRFRHSERFSGVLVGPSRASLERGTRRGFEAMNRALKARVEGGVQSVDGG